MRQKNRWSGNAAWTRRSQKRGYFRISRYGVHVAVFSKSTHDRNERRNRRRKGENKTKKIVTNHWACFPADPLKNNQESGKMERDTRRDQS